MTVRLNTPSVWSQRNINVNPSLPGPVGVAVPTRKRRDPEAEDPDADECDETDDEECGEENEEDRTKSREEK